jgi:hypothetical protein
MATSMTTGCAQTEEPITTTTAQPLINGTQTIYEPEVGQLSLGCTATLIGPQEFLTAAHCIATHDTSGGFTVPYFEWFPTETQTARVTFDSEIPCSPSNCGTTCGKPGELQWCCDSANNLCAQWYDVERIFPQGAHICYADDLAIGKLTQPVTWLTGRQVSSSEPPLPSTLTVVGYGCNVDTWMGQSGFNVKRYITYNWSGQDSTFYCFGDSGGPTFIGGLFDGGPIVRVTSGHDYLGNNCGADPTQYKSQIDSMVSGMETGNILYRGQVQSIGFTPTVAAGQPVGTVGQRLEGIQIWSDTPGVVLWYDAYVQNIGWQSGVQDGMLAGTVGQSLRMEAIIIEFISPGPYHGVKYNAYLHGRGWQGWVTVGNGCSSNADCGPGFCYQGLCAAGTTGQSLSIEALEIQTF